MLRLIILFILFYFIFKAVRIFFRYLSSGVKDPDNFGENTPKESKYKDAEEVEFREIKTGTQEKKD